MAIKGKKKPQSRGGGGARRPSAAPRPVVAGRRRTPWYRTAQGRIMAAIVAVVLVGGLAALGLNARSNASETAARREALEDYVGRVRSLAQRLVPSAGDLASPPARIRTSALDDFGGRAARWATEFEEAHIQGSQIRPPVEAERAHSLFLEAILLYRQSARTFELAADLDEPQRAEAFQSAVDLRARADAVWTAAGGLIDAALEDVGAQPAALGAPTGGPRTAAPPPSVVEGKEGREDNGGRARANEGAGRARDEGAGDGGGGDG